MDKNQICFIKDKKWDLVNKNQICFVKDKKKRDLVNKNQICFVKDKKWDFRRGFIFIIQIYYACITYLWNDIKNKNKNNKK